MMGERYAELSDQRAVEREFYLSLSHLCNAWGIDAGDYQGLSYPLNLYRSYHHVNDQLQRLPGDVKLEIVQTEKDRAVFNTIRTYDTGHKLYYIPVEPLVTLMSRKEKRRSGKLLLSVLAYLYQVIRVGHYSDNDDYLCYVYEVISDWITTDAYGEVEDQQEMKAYCKYVKKEGKKTLSWLEDPKHLDRLASRIRNFEPGDYLDGWILKAAKSAFALMNAYPGRSIYRSINELPFDDEYDNEGVMRVDQYLSFYWNDQGYLYQQIWEFVNNELNEYQHCDEPTIVQWFDEPQALSTDDFSFEKRVFDLVENCCDILYSIE